jgi:ABC-type antimicrobial peptide transport system permease subunit
VDSVGIGVSYAGQRPERWTDRDGTTCLVRKVGCGLGDESFLKTMGAHLIIGRFLEQSDIGADRKTIVVNEAMARRFRLGDNPVGKTITRVTNQGPVPYEVVGVVNDVRDYGLNQEIEPIFYRPYQDMPLGLPLFIAFRTTVEPTSIYASLRKELKDLEPSIGAPYFQKVENILYDSTASHRIYMKCLMLSAAVGMGLAVLGIYGILAHSVAQRTKEVGIRIALGAHSYDIIRCTVWESVRSVLFGVAVGLLGTFWLSRFIESLLFGISPHDPATLAGVTFLIIAVAAVTAWIPARRAAKIDPMVALRYE